MFDDVPVAGSPFAAYIDARNGIESNVGSNSELNDDEYAHFDWSRRYQRPVFVVPNPEEVHVDPITGEPLLNAPAVYANRTWYEIGPLARWIRLEHRMHGRRTLPHTRRRLRAEDVQRLRNAARNNGSGGRRN